MVLHDNTSKQASTDAPLHKQRQTDKQGTELLLQKLLKLLDGDLIQLDLTEKVAPKQARKCEGVIRFKHAVFWRERPKSCANDDRDRACHGHAIEFYGVFRR